MVNQEKIRQMSHLAMLEDEVGKNEMKICSYQRIDYVLVSIVKGFIFGTICFAALLGLWFGYIWDDLNLYFADAQFKSFVISAMEKYVIFMIIYLIICVLVALHQHKKGRLLKRKYMKYLNRLNRLYYADRYTNDN